jgi:hypothetical protein
MCAMAASRRTSSAELRALEGRMWEKKRSKICRDADAKMQGKPRGGQTGWYVLCEGGEEGQRQAGRGAQWIDGCDGPCLARETAQIVVVPATLQAPGGSEGRFGWAEGVGDLRL